VTEPIADVGLRLLGSFGRLRIPWADGGIFNDADLREASAIIVRLRSRYCFPTKQGGKPQGCRNVMELDWTQLISKPQRRRRIPVVYTPFANLMLWQNTRCI